MDELEPIPEIEDKSLNQIAAEQREALATEAKAGWEAMVAESAKAELDEARAKEIAANQAAHKKDGLIFPPQEVVAKKTEEEIKAEKKDEHKAAIEIMTNQVLEGEYDVAVALSAAIEAYKILYQ